MDNTDQTPLTTREMAIAAGNQLRHRREQLGLSLAELAERTTVSSPQYLHGLESGRINVTRSKHLPSIAAALGISARDQALILGFQNEQPEDPRHSVDIFNPIDLPLLDVMLLSGETRLACRFGDEILVIDASQRELRQGRTYLVYADNDAMAAAEVAVCVSDNDDNLYLVVRDCILAPERTSLLGRVLHRGRNL